MSPRKTIAEIGWYKIAKEFGVPVAMLVAVCMFGARQFEWAATNIFQPLLTRQIECLPRLESAVRDVANAAQKQSETMSDVSDSVRAQGELHQKDHEELVRMGEEIRKLFEKCKPSG